MKQVGFILLLVVLITSVSSPVLPSVQAAQPDSAAGAQPAAPTADTPFVVAASGVSNYTLSAPKLFFRTPVAICPPADPTPGQSPVAPLADSPEIISRVATSGGLVRQLYNVSRACNQDLIKSNIVADADYVYFMEATGLYRLSTNANVGDAPELVNAFMTGFGYGYSFLAITADKIVGIYRQGVNTYLGYVLKSNHNIVDQYGDLGSSAFDLKTDGSYAYYRAGTLGTDLYRVDLTNSARVLVTSGVSGYYPEVHLYCILFPVYRCFYTYQIFIARGGSIFTYNNSSNTLNVTPIYTSADSTAAIYDLVADFGHLYFFEEVQASCGLFLCYADRINRTGRDGTGVGTLYAAATTISPKAIQNLTTDGSYIFWQEGGQILRLPGNASTITPVNVKVDKGPSNVYSGLEVTQGIQNLTNSVLLIRDRRTFVRFYVKADTAAVPGVTAALSNPAFPYDFLSPVNPAGTTLTVRTNPNRDDINQSFLFELPYSWVHNVGSLTLNATLNPGKIPLESNYADNTASVTVGLLNSPSLSVEFFRLNYPVNGITYSPRYSQDILHTYSWILRAYPLAGGVGENFKPRLWDVAGGTQLANWVKTTDPNCAAVYGGPNDDISLCASYYTNGWLYYYRNATINGSLNVGLKTNAFYYGMISDAAGWFPRGQAMYTKTSVGPAGIPGLGAGWDFDGTYADWYAAHEIGHSLGRAHPNAGSDDPATAGVYENCGHSRSDPSFPYGDTSHARAPIGNGSMEGFDRGDAALGISKAVLPNSIWNDVMSYCSNQWISDYTYSGMYNYMLLNPSDVQPLAQAPALVGDFLILAGAINPNTAVGGFALVRRVPSVVDLPAVSGTAYSIRLLNAADGQLARENIDTYPNDGGSLGFGHTLGFPVGTRKIQILRNSDNLVLATQLVSLNAPVVSSVALQSLPTLQNPLVTLNWNASDADGDPLTYDVAYSRDGGVKFQPIAIGIGQKTTQIDTSSLGGSGSAILRVTASDGVNTGFANSAAFSMPAKPPVPAILTPENNLHIHYGQLVNFEGLATDAQDGTLTGGGLTWSYATNGGAPNGILTTGGQISMPDFSSSSSTPNVPYLPVGSNLVTLTATNSLGQSASTSVTVIVDDDLNLPGPILTAAPNPVSWQVPAGTIAPQTFNITINNAGGGGDMTWSASENAPWLTLSATSGTVTSGGDPSVVTLTAKPAGLSSGATYSTTLTITKPAGGVPEQQVKIKVSLSVGDVHDRGVANPVYIPMIKR